MGQEGKKLLVIVGPTASGKSSLAIELAKKLNGEIISADSRQIYKGLEIGSGAVTKKESQGIKHHLIGIASLKSTASAARYQKLARNAMRDVWSRGKLPIVCGGTGFYIQAAVDGIIMPSVKPNKKLRIKLGDKTARELSEMLRALDLKRWQSIDKNNKRRLVRSIEIARSLGSIPPLKSKPIEADVEFLGIDISKDELARLIKKRVKGMIRRGFIDETRKLIRNGMPEEKINEFGFEYRDAVAYLNGIIKSKAALTDSMAKQSLQYAKRQMTWFRRDKRIHWSKNKTETTKIVKEFFEKKTTRISNRPN
jgi:tRNA dimethylallyltransferase